MSGTIVMLFVIALVVVVYVGVLPIITGVSTLKVSRRQRVREHSTEEDIEEGQFGGYLPPDEVQRREQQRTQKDSRMNRLKQRLDITKEDIPLKFSTGIGAGKDATLRKRGAPKTVDPKRNDPSAFDFDLDELIEDEQRQDREEEQQQFVQRAAKSVKELV